MSVESGLRSFMLYMIVVYVLEQQYTLYFEICRFLFGIRFSLKCFFLFVDFFEFLVNIYNCRYWISLSTVVLTLSVSLKASLHIYGCTSLSLSVFGVGFFWKYFKIVCCFIVVPFFSLMDDPQCFTSNPPTLLCPFCLLAKHFG